MSHRICNIHVATSCFPIQRLLAWNISLCNCHSSRGSQGLPRHTIMWKLMGSTWKSRSDSGEHWKGAPPFVSRQCFPNTRPHKRTEGESSRHGTTQPPEKAGVPRETKLREPPQCLDTGGGRTDAGGGEGTKTHLPPDQPRSSRPMAATECRHVARRQWGKRGRWQGRIREPEARGTRQHTPLARIWPRLREALSAGTAPAKEAGKMKTLGTHQHRPPPRLRPRWREPE